MTESPLKKHKFIQKIEQGMGRGVRSSEDHCVVFLMGHNLTSQLYSDNGIQLFSPATRAQIELSDKVSNQIQGKGLEAIQQVMMYCLDRNPQWVSTSKGVLASLSYKDAKQSNLLTIGQRKAFDYARARNFDAAINELRNVVNITDDNDKTLKSYLKQCLAEYINFSDSVEARKILMSAVTDNPRLTKPIGGIAYHKLESKVMNQARLCRDYLSQKSDNDPNKVVVAINGLLESLVFKPYTAYIFEEALKTIALYIGFNSQRPEEEIGKGSDVLWSVGNLKYLVIECKNGATTSSISKRDCNQLNGSGEWFTTTYDHTCFFTPILIHPSVKLDSDASLKPNTRIINIEKLDLLRKNISDFISSICLENKINDEKAIRERLIYHNLTADRFCEIYTTHYSSK